MFQARSGWPGEETAPDQRGSSLQDQLPEAGRDVCAEPQQADHEEPTPDHLREEHDADGNVTRTGEDSRLTVAPPGL